ncbi:hypothetical protein DPX16_11784 [Anabarilius grahami]|uniref:Uncharacterized protein n=1 Tax=Anabarilius grahami TaxID=495550 RepID=A0A3N0Z830_ANAGA|nr:hypothetical protein DPX16_11784 [Anabarilius grahami]
MIFPSPTMVSSQSPRACLTSLSHINQLDSKAHCDASVETGADDFTEGCSPGWAVTFPPCVSALIQGLTASGVWFDAQPEPRNVEWLRWRQLTGVLCDEKMPEYLKAKIYKTFALWGRMLANNQEDGDECHGDEYALVVAQTDLP